MPCRRRDVAISAPPVPSRSNARSDIPLVCLPATIRRWRRRARGLPTAAGSRSRRPSSRARPQRSTRPGQARREERPGRFVIGEQLDGSVLTGDLADSATPHLLVGGQAGSGKSWLLRTLVASLVHWHDPSAIRITLLDPKRVTFNVPQFAA